MKEENEAPKLKFFQEINKEIEFPSIINYIPNRNTRSYRHLLFLTHFSLKTISVFVYSSERKLGLCI